MDDEILSLINNNDWKSVLKMTNPIFKILKDGRTLFHYACIRGQKNIIDLMLNLKSVDIFKSDLEGNTGAHLLGIGGWDELLINLIKKEPTFLKIKNEYDKFIFNIVINRPTTLEKIIELLEQNSMIEYINYVRNDGKTFLLDLIKVTEKTNDKIYYDILKKIKNYATEIPISRPPLHYAISKGYMKVAEFMINEIPIDVNLRDVNSFNVLILSLLYKEVEFVKILLKNENIDVNYGGAENRYIPLSILIKNNLFELYEDLKKHNLNYNACDNMLNIPVHYLIDILSSSFDEKYISTYKEILLNSDLNFSNYEGTTCLHLLVKFNLWEKFADVLEKKEINPNVTNKNGKNVLSYLKDDKLKKFVGIIDKQLTNNKNIKNNFDVITNVKLPPSENSHEFGTFNADSIHNITYLMYILNKYSNVTIPMQYPNIEKHMWDTYLLNLNETNLQKHDSMISTLGFYTSSFYAIVPHIVFWRNKNFKHLNSNIEFYLKRAIKSNCRFVILKLTLAPQISFLHANILIYDKTRNTVTRFEPYGDWDFADSYHLDKMLFELFEKVIDQQYKSTFKFIRPNEYLDKTKFQSTSLGDDYEYKNLGDPDGYCLAWSYWFVELKLLNPDVNEKDLVKNAFDLILKENKDSINPILQHIRGYSKHLDKEKNAIFDSVGISKQLHYKLNFQKEKINLIINYVNNYVVHHI